MKKQTLIALAGCPFLGKTLIGDFLREELSIPFIAVDRLRPVLFGSSKKYSDDPSADAHQLNRAYPAMLAVAETLLKLGDSVIVEGTFSKKEYQQNIVGYLLEKFPHIALKMVLLEIPNEKAEEILLPRVKRRMSYGSSSGATSIDDYWRVKNRFEPIIYPHLKINAAMSSQEVFGIALEFILA
jgi:predicted kinase